MLQKSLSLLQKNSFLIGLILVSFIFLTRLSLLFETNIAFQEWDPVARITIALRDTPNLYKWFFPVSWWLPLQFYLIRFVSYFTNNEQVLIYLSVLFYGFGFFFQFKLLSRYSLESINRTFLLLFLMVSSLNSVIFFTSLAVLTEPIFYFLSSLTLYFFFLIHEGKKYFWLFLLASSCNNLLRFESWLITFFLALPLLLNRQYRIQTLLLAIVPISWLYVQIDENGDLLNWIRIITSDGERSSLGTSPIKAFIETTRSLWLIFPLALPFMSFKFRLKLKNKVNYLHFITIFLVSFISFALYTQKAQLSHRYIVSGLFFLITSIGFLLVRTQLTSPRKWLFGLFLLLYCIFNIWEIRQPYTFHQPLISKEINEVMNKVSSMELSKKNRLFITRVGLIDDFIYLSENLLGTNKIIQVEDFASYAFHSQPHLIWKIVEKEKILYRNDLRYLLHIHSGFYEAFDKEQLQVLELPKIIKEEFNIIWQNKIGVLYERKSE